MCPASMPQRAPISLRSLANRWQEDCVEPLRVLRSPEVPPISVGTAKSPNKEGDRRETLGSVHDRAAPSFGDPGAGTRLPWSRDRGDGREAMRGGQVLSSNHRSRSSDAPSSSAPIENRAATSPPVRTGTRGTGSSARSGRSRVCAPARFRSGHLLARHHVSHG